MLLITAKEREREKKKQNSKGRWTEPDFGADVVKPSAVCQFESQMFPITIWLSLNVPRKNSGRWFKCLGDDEVLGFFLAQP